MKIFLPWLRDFVRLPEGAASVARVVRERVGVGAEPDGDEALVLEVTPNRPDLLSHLGLARELAAALGRRVVPPPTRYAADDRGRPPVRVRVEEPRLCPRYSAAVVEGVRVGPSPRPIAERLEACGLRPISNLVDVTNYVLLEVGQPLHAFDLDRLEGGVVVRRAVEGERIVTLDGVGRTLAPDDLVIADGRGPVALAGVMGGAGSEVTNRTTRILLEAACFDPSTVRRTSRRLGLRTESSYRFERGIDVEAVETALRRAVRLVLETAGGSAHGAIIDVRRPARRRKPIAYRPAEAAALLGAGGAPPAAHERLLRALGASVRRGRGGALAVEPPRHRLDLVGPEDLLEEVARLWGYERFDETFAPVDRPAGLGRPFPPESAGRRAAVRTLRRALAAWGLHECVTFPFEADGAADAVRLRNPMGAQAAALRTSPWAALRAVAETNRNRGAAGAALFEAGRLFRRVGDRVEEEPVVAALLEGEIEPAGLGRPARCADFAAARGVAEAALAALGIEPAWTAEAEALVAPEAEVRRLGGGAGPSGGAYGVLFRVEACAAAARPPRHRPLPRFPPAVRDVALAVGSTRRSADVEAALRAGAGERLESLRLFDRFEMPDGRVSLAYRLVLRAPDRTLTAEEVEAAVEAAVERAARDVGASLRGSTGA